GSIYSSLADGRPDRPVQWSPSSGRSAVQAAHIQDAYDCEGLSIVMERGRTGLTMSGTGASSEPGLHWNADAARHDDRGRRFWAFVTTVPLTLLTLASLFAASRASGPLRKWWLVAS